MSYFKCQQWNEALQDLLAYLPNDPENMEVKVCISKVYIDEAEEYRTNEKLELALEYFEKALALIKTNLIARLGRARCLIRLHVRVPSSYFKTNPIYFREWMRD